MPSNSKKNIVFSFFGILCFLFMGTCFTSAQDAPVYFKLDSPKLVKANSIFSVSLISSIFDEATDKIDVNIFVDDGISIKKAVLKQNDQTKNLRIFRSNKIHSQNVYTLSIDIDDSFNKAYPYQIVYAIKSNNQTNTKIEFSVTTYAEGQILHEYNSRDELQYKFDLSVLEIEFFDESRIQEKPALKFGAISKLYCSPVENINNNLAVDFWINFAGIEKNFFSIMDDLSNEKIVAFSRNSFGILSVDFEGNIESHKECFLSNNVWNHVTIEFKYFENSFNVFVNDSLAYSILPYSFIDIGKISYLFENEDADSPFNLYGFRIWDFGDDIVELQKNKCKSRVILENSNIKKEISVSYLTKNYSNQNNNDIVYNNIIVESNSDVPIFSQVPECNVTIQSSFYSIGWTVNDTENADYFEIEKSTDGKQYVKIGEVTSSYDKVEYDFLDAKKSDESIVYFRVKQVNTDETKVYSASVKVGVSKIEEFVLEQNYPNPFNPTTRISVEIIIPNDFDINIYDVTGEKIGKLHKGFLSQGVHEFTFNGADLPSGIYFCEVKSDISSVVKKMILAK